MFNFYETLTAVCAFVFFVMVAFYFIMRKHEKVQRLNKFISRKSNVVSHRRKISIGILTNELKLAKTAGYKTTLPEYVILCISSIVVAAVLIQFALSSMCVTFLGSLFFAVVPHFFFVNRSKVRSERLFMQMSPMLRNMANFLRAGRNQLQSIEAVIPSLESPMLEIMKEVHNRVLARDTVIQALTHASRNISLSEFEDFVLKFEINSDIGGDLAKSLEDLANLIDSKKELKNEIKGATMENRMSSYIMAVIPIGLFFLFKIISPDYVERFFDSPATTVGLGIAFGMIGLGVFLVRKMCKINVDY